MVVQCTNCRARFRVSDEKVPERGVKVRCTKCSTVFKVTKADAVDTGAKAAASRDPFGLDSPLPATPNPESTNVDDPFAAALATPPGNRVVPAVPAPVSLTYGAASPHQSLDLDLSLGPPGHSVTPGQRPPMPARAPTPLPYEDTARTLDEALGQAAQGGDPFADLGLSAPPAQPPPPFRSPPPAGVDPFAVGPPPARPQAMDDPFAVDVGGLPPDQAPGPFIPPQFMQPPPPQQPADPWVALMQSQPRKEETDPFAGLDAGPASVPPPAMAPAPLQPSMFEPPPERVSAPPSRPPPPREASLRPPGSGHEFEIGEATRGHSLDIDYDRLGLDSKPQPIHEPKRDAVDLGRIGAPKPSPKPATPAPAEERSRSADAKAAVRARTRKELASSIFNVVSVCLVLYAAIVAVAWFRAPRAIGVDDLGFPVVWLALGSGSDSGDTLRASQIHSGIYPTNAGGEVFYVEGMATNETDAKQDALYARILISRGDRMVMQADSLALRPPPPESAEDVWPEQLWKLDTRKNEDLQKALAKDTPSLEVPAHQSAPFIAVFRLNAKDVQGCDVHVTVHSGVPPTLRAALEPATPSTSGLAAAPAAPAPPTQTADARTKLP